MYKVIFIVLNAIREEMEEIENSRKYQCKD